MTNFSDMINFIRSMLSQDRKQLHTFALGKIENFDAVNMRAEVKLLENVHHNGKYYKSPIIVDCLVQYPKTQSFYIRMPYQKGDKVCVAFGESNISDIMISGEETDQTLSRRHSEDDCIVIGGWISENKDDKMSSSNTNDIVIVNTKHNSSITFTEDNNININNVDNVNVQCKNSNVTAQNNTINGTTIINGQTTINGTLNVSDSVSTPTVSASSSLTVGGTEMKSHKHGGVQSGSSFTSPV